MLTHREHGAWSPPPEALRLIGVVSTEHPARGLDLRRGAL